MADWLAILKAYIDTLETNLGDASGDNLTSIVAKLGDDTVTLKARLDAIDAAIALLATAADLALAQADITAIKAVTDVIPDAGAMTSIAQDATVAKEATLNAAQGDITAIKAITDVLPDAGALTSLAQDATVAKEASLAALALEATLTAIKGGGWSTETLVTIEAAILALNNLAQSDILNDATPFAGGDVGTIKGLVDSAETAGPYSYLDAGGEQTVVEDAAVTRRRINVEFSNRNMTQTGKFILYRKIDGSNYDIWTTVSVTVTAGDDRAFDAEFSTNQAWKLTYTEDSDEAAARDIPFNVITQVIE